MEDLLPFHDSQTGVKVHVAIFFEICVVKGAELEFRRWFLFEARSRAGVVADWFLYSVVATAEMVLWPTGYSTGMTSHGCLFWSAHSKDQHRSKADSNRHKIQNN